MGSCPSDQAKTRTVSAERGSENELRLLVAEATDSDLGSIKSNLLSRDDSDLTLSTRKAAWSNTDSETSQARGRCSSDESEQTSSTGASSPSISDSSRVLQRRRQLQEQHQQRRQFSHKRPQMGNGQQQSPGVLDYASASDLEAYTDVDQVLSAKLIEVKQHSTPTSKDSSVTIDQFPPVPEFEELKRLGDDVTSNRCVDCCSRLCYTLAAIFLLLLLVLLGMCTTSISTWVVDKQCLGRAAKKKNADWLYSQMGCYGALITSPGRVQDGEQDLEGVVQHGHYLQPKLGSFVMVRDTPTTRAKAPNAIGRVCKITMMDSGNKKHYQLDIVANSWFGDDDVQIAKLRDIIATRRDMMSEHVQSKTNQTYD